MNTLTLQRQANILEKFIKKGSRLLLEFEVAQAKWEIAHGYGKAYKSADSFMRSIRRRAKKNPWSA